MIIDNTVFPMPYIEGVSKNFLDREVLQPGTILNHPYDKTVKKLMIIKPCDLTEKNETAHFLILPWYSHEKKLHLFFDKKGWDQIIFNTNLAFLRGIEKKCYKQANFPTWLIFVKY